MKLAFCPYCGLPFSGKRGVDWDLDHVVARRFVPVGSLNGQKNIKIAAHRGCNKRKSDLENELSAVTIAPSPMDEPSSTAKERWDVSRKKRQSVKSSVSGRLLSVPPPKSTTSHGWMTINTQALVHFPAQAAADLATMQIQGLFAAEFDRYICATDVHVHARHYPKSDWGNITISAFKAAMRQRMHLTRFVTAQGWFRVAYAYDDPQTDILWLIDWNDGTRMFGIVANDSTVIDDLPKPQMTQIMPNLRMREEIPENAGDNFWV